LNRKVLYAYAIYINRKERKAFDVQLKEKVRKDLKKIFANLALSFANFAVRYY